MASKRIASNIMTCPLPFCPAPTLFVGKCGLCHCVGCWRQFTPGATEFDDWQEALQVSPPKRWLRRYSPHQRKRGPPPALLVPPDACSCIKGSTCPRRASVGTDSDTNPLALSSDLDGDDEDLKSTARDSGPTGTDEECGADSPASGLVQYSQLKSNLLRDKDTASSTGRNVSKPQVEEADAICGFSKWRPRRLTIFGSKLVFKMEKIE